MTDSQRRIPFMPIVTINTGSFAEDLRNIADFGAQIVELNFTDLADVTAAREELQRLGLRLWVNTLEGHIRWTTVIAVLIRIRQKFGVR